VRALSLLLPYSCKKSSQASVLSRSAKARGAHNRDTRDPSMCGNCSSGTLSGDGRTFPATAADRQSSARVKVMLPSTFCTIWWMWPLSM